MEQVKNMDCQNIRVEYRDAPEKYRGTADEVISFLLENLRILNTIEEECSQLNEYQERGIRIKGMPKDSAGIWALYKARYGEAAAAFCTDKLIERGYAQSMNGRYRIVAPDGTLIEEKIYGRYAYVNYGCALAVTMKSSKRATIEIFFISKGRLNRWQKFILTNTDKWRLSDIKQKLHENDKWKNDTL